MAEQRARGGVRNSAGGGGGGANSAGYSAEESESSSKGGSSSEDEDDDDNDEDIGDSRSPNANVVAVRYDGLKMPTAILQNIRIAAC